MLPFQDRYSRQRKLPEVGQRGQQRIEALRVVVRGGPEALIELAYLERAGAQHVEFEPGPAGSLPDWPHRGHFTHSGPQHVAAGAWMALRRIRQALEADGAEFTAVTAPTPPNPRDPP